jgi:hypothetical protein
MGASICWEKKELTTATYIMDMKEIKNWTNYICFKL